MELQFKDLYKLFRQGDLAAKEAIDSWLRLLEFNNKRMRICAYKNYDGSIVVGFVSEV